MNHKNLSDNFISWNLRLIENWFEQYLVWNWILLLYDFLSPILANQEGRSKTLKVTQ